VSQVSNMTKRTVSGFDHSMEHTPGMGHGRATDQKTVQILQESARIISLATQIPCRAINLDGDFVGETAIDAECHLCSYLANPSSEDAGSQCQAMLQSKILQAERFGGAYISFCPGNLLVTLAVVREDARVRGALVLGPMLLVDRLEFFSEEIMAKTYGQDSNLERARAILDTIQNVDTKRAKALADTLEIAAQNASDALMGRFDPKIESSESNAKIAEYIQSLKSQGFDSPRANPDIVSYPFRKERLLIHYVTTGNRTEARRVLNEILGNVFFSEGGELKAVKARAAELTILLSRAAAEGGATPKEVFGSNEDFLRYINAARSVEDVASLLSSVLNRFTDLIFPIGTTKHAETIRKAECFIREHYTDNLTLYTAANEAKLSPPYFSTVFKEETGKSFTSFLNELRIARAKELLKDNALPISEISAMVGFFDQSYFSRVFRNAVGVSPALYRKKKFSPEADIEIHEEQK